MTCKHWNRDYAGRSFVLQGRHTSVHQAWPDERRIYATSASCLDCKVQLAVGTAAPSSASEIRAAEIEFDARQLGIERALNAFATPRGFTGSLVTLEEMAGWTTHSAGESAHDMRGGEAGWLSRQIYRANQTHDVAETVCDNLVAFIDGEIDDIDKEQMRGHLVDCAACRAALPEGMQLSARLSGLKSRVSIEPLPGTLSCATCGVKIGSADALDGGWVCIEGRWYCRADRPLQAPVVDGQELPELVDVHDEPTHPGALVIDCTDAPDPTEEP